MYRVAAPGRRRPWRLSGGRVPSAGGGGSPPGLGLRNPIGAINSAIIAGNPPEERVAKLRAFWEGITTNPLFDWTAAADRFAPKGDIARSFFNQMSAAWALVGGSPGFFTLRQPGPWLQPAGSLERPELDLGAPCRRLTGCTVVPIPADSSTPFRYLAIWRGWKGVDHASSAASSCASCPGRRRPPVCLRPRHPASGGRRAR